VNADVYESLMDSLGPLGEPTRAVVKELAERDALARLLRGDHTLWQDDPTEVADRLGWVPVVDEVRGALRGLRSEVDALVAGVDTVLLMGMGGSSLFPEVLAQTDESRLDGPTLVVLDTTHPAAIARLESTLDPARTLHVAASKSGSTIETRSHLEWAWERHPDPARFAVITDPGSELASLARQRGFAAVFENRSDIGGRYSALSLFGIVPALAAAVDADELLVGGLDVLEACAPGTDAEDNSALLLGAAMAAGARTRRDKLTLHVTPGMETFGLWVEQLVAESTGKHGTGVVPVIGEPLGSPEVYGDDRVFVVDPAFEVARDQLTAGGASLFPWELGTGTRELGRAVVLWELATALCGAALEINPFDQPDVAAAKDATARALAEGVHDEAPESLDTLLSSVRDGDYIAVHAYVDPGDPVVDRIEATRAALRDELHVATTFGLGPRFLHSTGQLHKGGPASGVFVQIVDDDDADVPIPGRPFGFGTLLRAQAAGDLATLRARGLRAARVSVGDLLEHAS
jgi:glucose-6-phosphate isomerase